MWKTHRFSILFSFSNRYFPIQSQYKNRKALSKYVQSKTKTKFCLSKWVKPFYKCVHFLFLWLPPSLSIYHFYCFPILFLLPYVSFQLDSLDHQTDFPHFLHFHPAQPSVLNHCLHHLRRHQWYHQKKVTWKCLKFIVWKVWPNNYVWMKCYLRFMSKKAQLALNYQLLRNLYKANFGFDTSLY